MNEGLSPHPEGPAGRGARLPELICLGFLVTLAYVAVPSWLFQFVRRFLPLHLRFPFADHWSVWAFAGSQLALGLLLALSAPTRSGIRVGSFRPHWKKVLFVCGLPVALTGIVYPLLPFRPFSAQHMTVWLLSPLSQDLVFIGYLYGCFEPAARSYLHRRIRIRWALVLTAAFFSLHHFVGLGIWPAGFVAFQMFYTFLWLLVIGLSRQWTGSMLYVTIAHTAINLIAWAIP